MKYTNKYHDVSLTITEGALLLGEKATTHVEIGVMPMYGPFLFAENTRPISPIVWLCLTDKNVQLKKPLKITLPHILSRLTVEKSRYYDVTFAKALHSDSSIGMYNFQSVDGGMELFSDGDQSYGTLETSHFCYICITAKDKPDFRMDAGYCLTRVESYISQLRHEVYFCVSYHLKTCLQV